MPHLIICLMGIGQHMKILKTLDSKFQENSDKFLSQENSDCKKIDLKARAIAAIGQISSDVQGLQASQIEITRIYNEVFSDIILSLYFTACALDRPAQSVLRRALELGVAIVYLWDLPHVFWGWKNHDYDLNFNEMLEHLLKDGYKSYLTSLNIKCGDDRFFDFTETRKLYRKLSDTIHGKIATHETTLPDRFSSNPEDWKCNLFLINNAENILLQLYNKRFPEYYAAMAERMPLINTSL